MNAPGRNFDIKTEIATYWGSRAATFDDQPSHFIRQGRERETWRAVLARHMPAENAHVLELGCGTGLVTELLLDCGYRVSAVDLAEEMLQRARDRVGQRADIRFADAEDPYPMTGPFDAILSRHLVWTLPDPSTAFRRWFRLLRPGGRVIIIDGRWETGRLVDKLLKRLATLVEGKQAGPDSTARLESPDSPYSVIRHQLPFGIAGPPPEDIAELLKAAGFLDVRIDPLRDLKAAQRAGRPLGFRLRSHAMERYIVRART
jgi:SAM-dependent methyltransferase